MIILHGINHRYAIGGLAGGEDKTSFWTVVALCAERYCSGKIPFLSSELGFHIVYILQGLLRIKSADFASDGGPLDATCACFVCTEYSRAYLHHVMKKDGSIGPQLITYHNVAYMLHLMAQVRQAILNDSFPSFVRAFMAEWHQGTPVPAWVHDALNYVGIPLNQAE
ncbi:hypothetical protein DYB30_010560 [Aphanomyces astaci]|uniref:tRNA-guanine(15) transglycosylase-like domain-containing protein n=1 Tax=Aphanomyces astaci TaxID=112090 RepID=A0A397CMI4_APHAT|nr:hypothetical protein DYB30_010560 [Aphanomyces astaci]RHY83821.1 hypothetical protein DYB31_010384 [Aphanomyces astaci]